MVLERLAGGVALLALLEAAELQGVVLAAGANVIDKQVIVGDLVAVFGVVPKPTHVLDELAVVVDERIIQRDHPLFAIASRRVTLHQFQPSLVDRLFVPLDARNEAIQARLVGRLDELAVDARDGLVRRHHQAGEVLGEMPPLRLARKQIPELVHGLTHNLRKLHDRWHLRTLPGLPKRPSRPAPGQNARH